MQTYLNDDRLRELAPAVFADAPRDTVSDRYSFVPTIAVVNILRDSGWYPVKAGQANVRAEDREGLQRHFVRFARPETDLGAERVELALTNSHDATAAFNLFAALYRKVCANGLMHGSDLYRFRHKHVGFDGNALVESAHEIGNSASEIAREVDSYKAVELADRERTVFAEAAHKLLWTPEDAPVDAERLLRERRFDDKGKDLWTTYNVVQENLTKGGLSYRTANGRRNRTRKVKNIEKDVALNRALWSLTTRMAEIKAS